MGVMKMRISIFVGKIENKRTLGRPAHAWEDNIKIYISWTLEVVNWMYLAEYSVQWRALVITSINPHTP
jgi:hypothetical protein